MVKKPSYEELESKIEHLNTDLEAKKTEVDSLKSLFLANISHEIRTPMNAIVGFSNLLADPTYNESQKKFFIDEINKNSRDLLRLIDNVLISSKIQAQHINPNLSNCQPDEILNKLYLNYKTRLKNSKRSNIELKLIIPEFDSPPHLFSDPEKLELALSNLIDNAVKFTENGIVEFGYQVSGKNLTFFINDTGKGISPKAIHRIFKNFYQESYGFEAKEPGIGIGLSLSDKLIKLLGGKLVVKSVPDQGSTFSFSLPLKIEKAVELK